MFARHVTVKLNPSTLAEFTRVMDNEILPWLRKQKGFLDTITLAVPGGGEIVSISFWDQEENALVYNSTSYPEALQILKKILAGTPQVRTFDVVSSTLQRVDPPKTFFSTVRGRQQEHGEQHDSSESSTSCVSFSDERAAYCQGGEHGKALPTAGCW
jgi:heme-degrading monooxygenase HmoA